MNNMNNTTENNSKLLGPPNSTIDKPSFTYSRFITALTTTNSLLHALGFTLLLLTWKDKKKKTPQHLYLLNLSFIECLSNICLTAMYIGGIQHGGSGWSSDKIWLTVISSIYFTFNIYLHFSIMFVITADRLAAAWLNMQYVAVCTIGRTKILLSATWVLCLGASVGVLGYNYTVNGKCWIWKLWQVYVHYLQSVLSSLYIIFAVVAYLFMFVRYIHSKRSSCSTEEECSQTTFQLFRRSKFYISLLLITSFLIFMLIPIMIMTIKLGKLPEVVSLILVTFISLSDTVDFIIYVFIYRPVFDWLKSLREDNSDSDNIHIFHIFHE